MASDILVKIGADITDFSRKMSESQNKLKRFNQANQETFQSFRRVGAMATGAGAAVAGGLGFAVKKAADFESAMSKVEAISGSSGDEMEQLSDKAREMGAKTSFSASEAAEGLNYMALAGWDTQEMMDGLEPILHLAEAGALDLGVASDLVTDSMAALGLESQDLEGYLDKVAATASNSNTDIDALMEAMVTAGSTFSRFNVPLDEANGFLGILANRGFKGSEAGRALNSIMAKMTSGTGQAGKAMEDLGVSAFDSEGNFRGMEEVMYDVKGALDGLDDDQRAHYQTMLSGLEHTKTFGAILDGLGDEYQDLKGDVKDSDGALKEMRDTMKDNLQGALENLNSAIDEVMISLGEALLPAVKALTAGLQRLADWFNNLGDGTKRLISIIAGIAAVFLLVVGPILTLIGFIPLIIAGFSAIATVIAAIGAPILAVVAAAAAAVIAIIAYWEPIKEFFIKLWDGIKAAGIAIWDFLKEAWSTYVEYFKSIWEPIIEFFGELWESIVEVAASVWDTLKEVWQSAVEFLKEIFTPIIEFFADIFNSVKETVMNVWETITEALSTAWEGIKDIASGVWEGIKNAVLGPILLLINLLTGDFEELKSNLSSIWNNIKSAASKVWNGIKTVISSFVNALKDNVTSVWNGIKSVTSTVFNAIKSIASSVWNGIKSTISSVVNGVKSAVSGAWNNIKSTTSSVFNGIKSTASSVWSGIKSTISNIVTGAKDKVISVWNSLKSRTKSIFEGMKNVIKNPLKAINLLSIGKDIISGLIDGIKSKVSAVAGAVKDVTSKITGKIKGILGIASPSKVTKQFGRWTGEGLEIGINDMDTKVAKAADGLAKSATPDMKDISFGYETPSRKGSLKADSTPSALHNVADKLGVGSGGVQQSITINSPEPTSPSDNARKMRQASRRLAMEWGV